MVQFTSQMCQVSYCEIDYNLQLYTTWNDFLQSTANQMHRFAQMFPKKFNGKVNSTWGYLIQFDRDSLRQAQRVLDSWIVKGSLLIKSLQGRVDSTFIHQSTYEDLLAEVDLEVDLGYQWQVMKWSSNLLS